MTTDAHGRSSESQLVFTEPDVRAPTHAERARTLVAGESCGALATLALEPAGYPYGSFVTFALDAGHPVFLISRIAEHTRNLAADARASLLVHEVGQADPLANGRVTLIGRAVRLPREVTTARSAFLTVHPQSAYYVDFSDFDFWCLRVEAVRYIGGYGRMSWVDAGEFAQASADPLAPAARGILEHMNADHRKALRLYARAFTRASDAEQATMTAIDRHGFEMTIQTPAGIGPARIAFERTLASADDARPTLIALLRAAEAQLGRTGA
jgi:putative heme iron utilization protein